MGINLGTPDAPVVDAISLPHPPANEQPVESSHLPCANKQQSSRHDFLVVEFIAHRLQHHPSDV